MDSARQRISAPSLLKLLRITTAVLLQNLRMYPALSETETVITAAKDRRHEAHDD
jgi:hypothetical protein